MNRKDIERAAVNYTYKEWARGGFKRASQNIFIAGAKWHINSVWLRKFLKQNFFCIHHYVWKGPIDFRYKICDKCGEL